MDEGLYDLAGESRPGCSRSGNGRSMAKATKNHDRRILTMPLVDYEGVEFGLSFTHISAVVE